MSENKNSYELKKQALKNDLAAVLEKHNAVITIVARGSGAVGLEISVGEMLYEDFWGEGHLRIDFDFKN